MLPTGMTSLRKIRKMDCYYVDKTDHLRRLVEGGQYYFLSRPRRFGKTLLVDTLQKLFEGSEELFRGLAVHGKWDWSAHHPVVRISFGGGNFDSPDFVRKNVEDQLAETERLAGLEPGPGEASIRFRRLIRTLHERTGQRTVVLVDEYDKPILDALGDRETGAGQPGLPARLLRDDQGLRRAAPLRFPDGGEPVLAGGHFLGPEQPARHHPRSAFRRPLRLHGRGTGRGLRPGTRGPGPGRYPALVQRLQLARRGQGLQPVRHSPSLRNARVQGALVPDRHAALSRRPCVAAPGRVAGPGVHDRGRRTAVGLRRRRHFGRGAFVPDRLPDHRWRGDGRRPVPAGLSEPRSEAQCAWS